MQFVSEFSLVSPSPPGAQIAPPQFHTCSKRMVRHRMHLLPKLQAGLTAFSSPTNSATFQDFILRVISITLVPTIGPNHLTVQPPSSLAESPTTTTNLVSFSTSCWRRCWLCQHRSQHHCFKGVEGRHHWLGWPKQHMSLDARTMRRNPPLERAYRFTFFKHRLHCLWVTGTKTSLLEMTSTIANTLLQLKITLRRPSLSPTT